MTDDGALEAAAAIRTETDATVELAARPSVLDRDGYLRLVAVPPGWRVEPLSVEAGQARPSRRRGTIAVHDAASFVREVSEREEGTGVAVYADAPRGRLVAILNDDEPTLAGWRDYRVELALVRTPAWQAWLAGDGELHDQERFADHVEDRLRDVTSPPAADLLELAQTFHATTTAAFKQANRIASGETQLVYEETIDARAGQAGQVVIPDRIELTLEPFYGAGTVDVSARFRYRLVRGGGAQAVRLGWKLDDPERIERDVFEDVVAEVRGHLEGVRVIDGVAPEPAMPVLR